MRTIYHEFESLEHLLGNRLLPGGGDLPIRFVLFGGTGAVGGATALELCRLILASPRYRQRPLHGEIYATAPNDKEIANFVRRLYMDMEGRAEIEKVEPLRHYRIDGCIDLHFAILRLALPHDLRDHVREKRGDAADGDAFDPEKVLADYFAAQPKPFLEFVEALEGDDVLHAVVVAIPLPSVATYTLEVIDGLAEDELELDHKTAQRIKTSYLQTFISGLAIIQQRHARHVVLAHTTAVGGMYRVDGGAAEIRLGFAHSALGKKLVDKKYFADELTQLYIDNGFEVLVTAAAVGIDAVDFGTHLPLDRAVHRALTAAVAEDPEQPPIAAADLDSSNIQLYPWHVVPLDEEDDGDDSVTPPRSPQGDGRLAFGAGKELIVEAVIRSGENGLFSVANCVALYNVMKVAIPEELAMVLVRFALFGPERRRGWFENGLSYYAETENAHFALRLLEGYPQLKRAHVGAFAVQAYQALGSSTHQARLHELGLLLMVLRMRQLRGRFEDISEQELTDGLQDLDDFFWRHTKVPAWEELVELDATTLAEELGALCAVDSMEDAGQLIGFDPRRHAIRERGRERFLARLATTISRYVQTITSLGIPIIHQHADGDRLLVGPHVAPLDTAVSRRGDVLRMIRRLADEHGIPYEVARDWMIVNNGFVDLRPHALVNSAKEPGPHLREHVATFTGNGGETVDEQIAAWIDALPAGSYFTTCGLGALRYRLHRLYAKVTSRKIELGTRETWKNLFPQGGDRRYILSPGLIETCRMYSEGLGKVTGTERLWPDWGY